MVTSYDAPARPQYWQLHEEKGVGINFIAFYSPKSKLSDIGKEFAKAYQEKYKEPPVYCGAERLRQSPIVFARRSRRRTPPSPRR